MGKEARKRVAVFDFDHAGRTALMELLDRQFGAEGAALSAFGDSQAVARAVQGGGYDMAFVVVNGMPAVETARLVRESGGGIQLFLVSRTGDYALEGFRLHALDYLIQPVSAERVVQAVTRIGGPARDSLADMGKSSGSTRQN